LKTLFLSETGLKGLLDGILKERVGYFPVASDDNYTLRRFEGGAPEPLTFNSYRFVEPLKSIFFGARETVYPIPEGGLEARAVFGVKSCDLESLKNLDYIFMGGELEDPVYTALRRNTLIVSGDCTDVRESCFCTSVGVSPYPEEGFDLNVSEISGGFLVDVGSPLGEEAIGRFAGEVREASEGELREREERRREILGKLKELRGRYPEDDLYYRSVKGNFDSEIWEEKARDCVECGACNLVCPNCYCFILYDRLSKSGIERARVWDSCQYKSFARVAGGLNPRQRLAQRVRHRFMHKFVYLPDSFGGYGCVGCGRCVEACIAKIDMREILEDISV